jgi:hypothetical protein
MDRPEYRLGHNEQGFDAELLDLLQATLMIGDRVEDIICLGGEKIIMITDLQSMINQIQDN